VARHSGRVLMAKTSLDGHWRGVAVVSRALRDAGFEVVMLGAASADAALQEDVDIVGLNVGGRVEVVERILDRLAGAAPDIPVMAGGTIAPWARKRLEARGVAVFPPGSSLQAVVDEARRLSPSGSPR
jgi:methylmalonyl-CoA mutase, C-terminal domain